MTTLQLNTSAVGQLDKQLDSLILEYRDVRVIFKLDTERLKDYDSEKIYIHDHLVVSISLSQCG